MDNITGSAASWLNDKKENKKSNNFKEEEIIEIKKFDTTELNDLIRDLKNYSDKIDEIYTKNPKKELSDSSVLMRSAIRSLNSALKN